MLTRLSRIALPPLIVAAAFVAYRLGYSALGTERSALGRTVPWKIEPRFDEPRVVTDEQLAAVLDRVQPPTQPVKTNNIVHALRLWGVDAEFSPAQPGAGLAPPSGKEMLGYLLDDRMYQQLAGTKEPALFQRDADGIRARSFDDAASNRDTSSYHADDILATLAEVGTPLDTPMHLRGDANTDAARVQDLLDATLRRYHNDRLEYEWALIAYARYVFPQKHFHNKYGEKITLDAMIDEALGPPLELGPCNGLHRLEALAVLYRADEQAQALKTSTKLKMLSHMQRVSGLLTESQTVDGYWTRSWPQGQAAATPDPKAMGTLYDRILVTGHHLEWLALAPEDVQPPRETVVRAGQWLTRTLLEMDPAQLQEAYGPYTHAARALALWRKKEPLAAWRAGNPLPLIESRQL